MQTAQGFFAGLFDFSFQNFITVKIIKVLYILAIVGTCLVGLATLASGFGMMRYGVGAGILQVLLAPVITLLGIIWSRVLLEIIVVLFSIANNTTRIVEMKEKESI
ncbi:MAG: DUF4282 domain-containing protein [Thermodesulfovibrionales bacterium]|nr:DUF4282 domain-containing protein [Thermodesulfovibrionales bacterium]